MTAAHEARTPSAMATVAVTHGGGPGCDVGRCGDVSDERRRAMWRRGQCGQRAHIDGGRDAYSTHGPANRPSWCTNRPPSDAPLLSTTRLGGGTYARVR